MPEPAVCIYIYRDPVVNAMSLVENAKKSAQTDATLPMTAERWLSTWEEGVPTLHSMQSTCGSVYLCACKI